MNHTLLTLLAQCRKKVLDEMMPDSTNTPTSGPPTTKGASRPYDNAYFYILFVMLFYSFLALTLFRSFASHDKTKKDPYEEFVEADSSTRKYGHDSLVDKFDFEDESTP